MPAKRDLSRSDNFTRLLFSVEETRRQLEKFNAVLYHYANEDDPARIEAESILRQFKRLARETKKRALKTTGVLGDVRPAKS